MIVQVVLQFAIFFATWSVVGALFIESLHRGLLRGGTFFDGLRSPVFEKKDPPIAPARLRR